MKFGELVAAEGREPVFAHEPSHRRAYAANADAVAAALRRLAAARRATGSTSGRPSAAPGRCDVPAPRRSSAWIRSRSSLPT